MADAAEEKLREALIAEIEKMKARAKKVDAHLKRMKSKPPTFVFRGLVKAYMNAVKDSDGLTNARPATVKAVQSAEKSVTEGNIKAAIKGLGDHVKDAKKLAGSDKGKKKQFATFEKGINSVTSALAKHLK